MADIEFVGASAGAASDTDVTLNFTSPAEVLVGDHYVAAFLNRSRVANAVTPGGTNPTTNNIKSAEAQVADPNDDGDHQYTVIRGEVTQAGAQAYSFVKATDDNVIFIGGIIFLRNVDNADPQDATPPAVISQVFPDYLDTVAFPAYDPASPNDLIIYIAFYTEEPTAFAAAMSSDVNPDCTLRFEFGSSFGDDATIAITTGKNDGSAIAARTWASNAATDLASTGLVFALKASGGAPPAAAPIPAWVGDEL